MKTLTIEILDQKAMDLLQEMENQHLVKINKITNRGQGIDWVKKYKGKLTVKSQGKTDQQLDELRSSWE
jgi:hypothetical protein